jgi:hypothetical protein
MEKTRSQKSHATVPLSCLVHMNITEKVKKKKPKYKHWFWRKKWIGKLNHWFLKFFNTKNCIPVHIRHIAMIFSGNNSAKILEVVSYPKIVIFSQLFFTKLITSFIIKIEMIWKHIFAQNFLNFKILQVLGKKSFFSTSLIYLRKCNEVRASKYKSKWGGGGLNTTSNIFFSNILFTNPNFIWIKHYFKLLKTIFYFKFWST